MNQNNTVLINKLMLDPGFSRILNHCKKILEIDQYLKKNLPEIIVSYCRVANIRDNCLIIEVANAGLKILINSEMSGILKQLKKAGFTYLMKLKVKVNPNLYNDLNKKKSPKRYLSDNTKESLANLKNLISLNIQKKAIK
ncbi:hypothetical protein CF66_2245 [Candidatus Photodesmus katoptron]|uniref:DUF721 domain-containing protein n=1 Tax=Candidatus Photodesmus katoptron Akat1 TaxID=1236703 RepID=S3E0L6_9GAMM|nr:DciA family protein [Candidatus Photodesmus katoptron]EPE37716.1 hypothetical protein O1U_0175 [Candidatus Photodesmus katoptron Akat1]KEY90562.1 hypothetical protein CF66_2245 [Candidatus Photodesmus katoptron]